MSERPDDIAAAVEASRRNSADYITKPGFREYWLGITPESRDLLAQQLRSFGALLDGVTASLEGWKILDVGCGDGRWLRRMVEYDARPEDVMGIDISDVRFEIARAKNEKVKLLKVDAPPYPFGEASFDLVTQFVCFSTIPTEALRQGAAAEMRRVVKPGGYVFWWDLPEVIRPTRQGIGLDPADLFDWPIRRLEVSQRPRPSETLRGFPGGRLAGSLLDRLGFRPTHVAALIGPKP